MKQVKSCYITVYNIEDIIMGISDITGSDYEYVYDKLECQIDAPFSHDRVIIDYIFLHEPLNRVLDQLNLTNEKRKEVDQFLLPLDTGVSILFQ